MDSPAPPPVLKVEQLSKRYGALTAVELAGVFYPVSVLPAWMQAVSRILPPSYVFEGLRAVTAGRPAPWGQLGLGAGLAVLYVVLACFVFARVHRYAIRTGLLANYTAESVS